MYYIWINDPSGRLLGRSHQTETFKITSLIMTMDDANVVKRYYKLLPGDKELTLFNILNNNFIMSRDS